MDGEGWLFAGGAEGKLLANCPVSDNGIDRMHRRFPAEELGAPLFSNLGVSLRPARDHGICLWRARYFRVVF